MTPKSPDVAFPPELLKMAAEYKWANPGATWQAVADHVGRSKRQVERWRHSEEWEVAFRQAGTEYVERLAPAAVHALVKAWSKGNPNGALEVLRSFGFLRPSTTEVSVTHSIDRDLDAEIERLLMDVRSGHPR